MRELKEQAERHTEALEDLCQGIEAARLVEDEETREILQEEARRAREKVERIREELERIVTNFATENSRLEDENRRYKKDFGKKADAEHGAQFFGQERGARELAEAGKTRVEAQLAAEREGRGREKRESERQEHEREEWERRQRENQEKQERERKEHRVKEREWREAIECVNRELERMRRDLERLEEEKTSGLAV